MIARPQLFFLLLLLPLAACATARLEPGCADNAMCAARAAEPRLLAMGHAERHGDDLVLIPTRGERLVFTDNKKACETDDVDHCVGFALMGSFPKSGAWVLQRFLYEGGDFLLIDDRSGRQTRLNGMPVFSPDGGGFLVAPNDEESDVGPNNLEIWRRSGDGAVLEWAHAFDEILPDMYEVRVLRWDSNQISLVLSGNRGTNRKAVLTRSPTGWQLMTSPE